MANAESVLFRRTRIVQIEHRIARLDQQAARLLERERQAEAEVLALRLSLDETARIIAGAAGRRGANRDYLAGTVRHLAELGLADAQLTRLAERVEALAAVRG